MTTPRQSFTDMKSLNPQREAIPTVAELIRFPSFTGMTSRERRGWTERAGSYYRDCCSGYISVTHYRSLIDSINSDMANY